MCDIGFISENVATLSVEEQKIADTFFLSPSNIHVYLILNAESVRYKKTAVDAALKTRKCPSWTRRYIDKEHNICIYSGEIFSNGRGKTMNPIGCAISRLLCPNSNSANFNADDASSSVISHFYGAVICRHCNATVKLVFFFSNVCKTLVRRVAKRDRAREKKKEEGETFSCVIVLHRPVRKGREDAFLRVDT